MQVNNNSNSALSHSLRSRPVITENDKKVQEQGGDLTTNFFFNKLKFLLKATYLTYLHWCKYAEKSTVINPKPSNEISGKVNKLIFIFKKF